MGRKSMAGTQSEDTVDVNAEIHCTLQERQDYEEYAM
jgi:hypothetical protein